MSFTKEDTARAKGVGILLLMFHHLFYNPNFIENHGMEFWLIPQECDPANCGGCKSLRMDICFPFCLRPNNTI